MASFIADCIITAAAAPSHPDAALIDRCAEFMIATGQYKTEIGKPGEEGDGPVCVALEQRIDAIAADISTMRPQTPEGCLAVFRCLFKYDYDWLIRGVSEAGRALVTAAKRGLDTIDSKASQ